MKGSTYISSPSTNTCSSKLKHADKIKLTNCFNLTNLKTYVILIENNPGSIANIKSSSL